MVGIGISSLPFKRHVGRIVSLGLPLRYEINSLFTYLCRLETSLETDPLFHLLTSTYLPTYLPGNSTFKKLSKATHRARCRKEKER